MIDRTITIPEDVPEGYVPIIVVFARGTEGEKTTQICCHVTERILGGLRRLPLLERRRVVKDICSNVQLVLLQYSKNPEDVTIREV